MEIPYKNLIEDRCSIATTEFELENEKDAVYKGLFLYDETRFKVQREFFESRFRLHQCSLIWRAVLLILCLICIVFLITFFTRPDYTHQEIEVPIIFPKVRGPARRPQYPLCDGIQYLDCGYSWDEESELERHQANAGKLIIDFLKDENNKLDTQDEYALKQLRTAFKTCVRESSKRYNGTEVLEIIRAVLKEFSVPAPIFQIPGRARVTVLSSLLAKLQVEHGMDLFFKLRVLPNYMNFNKSHEYVLYLEPYTDHKTSDYSEFLLKEISSKNLHIQTAMEGFQKTLNFVANLTSLHYDVENPSEWIQISISEAREKWPWFDFAEYFNTLFIDLPELKRQITDHTFKFVVKAPKYFHDLQKLIYREDDFGDFLGYLMMSQKLRFMGSQEEYEARIRMFRIGHLTKPESTTETCLQDVKNYLPEITSKIYESSLMPKEMEILEDRFLEVFEDVSDKLEEMIDDAPAMRSDPFLRNRLKTKIRKIELSFESSTKDGDLYDLDKNEELNIGINENYFQVQKKLQRFAMTKKLTLLQKHKVALRSSLFEEWSSSTAQIGYSRLGNMLYVPKAFLTSPILCEVNDKNCSKSMIYWMIGREISKAIDSQGSLWQLDGTYHTGKTVKSTHLKATSKCLASHLKYDSHNSDLDSAINDIIGIRMALELYKKSMENSNEKSTLENFFKSLQPFYCSDEHMGSVMILLEKYMDYLMKSENTFGCYKSQINMNCRVWM